jgi:AraC-like DNA-binding protein
MVAELERINYDDGGGFMAGFITGTGDLWHFHPEYELVLNTKGSGTRIIGDNAQLFDQYDMVFVAGNIPHCWNYIKNGDSAKEKHGIMVHFKLKSMGEQFLSQYEMHSFKELLIESERGLAFSVDDAMKAENFLLKMINDKGIDKMIDFLNVIKILCSAEKRSYLCSENYKLAFDEKGNKKMSDVYTYIRENYFKPISIKRISKVAKMNPHTFSKYFKKNSGAGFIEYLNRVRTNKACYLLRETTYHVKDISVECGFGSISNFNKQFRKSEGVSPGYYRTQFN